MKKLYAVFFLVFAITCSSFVAKAGPDLATLTITSGSFSPAFDPAITSYTVAASNATTAVRVTPTVADAGSTIKVNGSTVVSGVQSNAYSVASGATITLTIVVTAVDATTKTYVVQVTRTNNNANLSLLAVNAGTFSPTFSSDVTDYANTLASTQTAVKIRPTVPTGTNATITINGTAIATGVLSPDQPTGFGNNIFSIVVSAPDGVTKKTYTITSFRPSLSGLATAAGAFVPGFSSGTTNYAVTAAVANTVTTTTITPTVADPGAVITINGSAATANTTNTVALQEGLNTFNIVVLAGDGVTTRTYVLKITRALSTNANLSGLALSDGTLTPAFDAATNSYTASVINNTSNITLTPTTANASATVKINGTTVASGTSSSAIVLNTGVNTITTVVTAGDGTTTNTYIVTITRDASANADLNGLILSSGTLSPAFASSTIAYTASVSNATSSIKLTPSVADADANITVNGAAVSSGSASSDIALNTGANTITVAVTAANGTTIKTYTINVTRNAPVNVDLSSLAISSGTLSPIFAAGTTSYTANVANTVTGITVTPTLSDALATVTVNGTAVISGSASANILLNTGSNTITTVVTAQDGVSTQTYTITVTRALSNIASLNALTLSSGTLAPVFASATNNYTASVANSVTGITLTPVVTQANATVTVNSTTVTSGAASGNIPLSVGANTITIKVTAQDGITTNTYTIAATRAASSNADLTNIVLSAGTLTPAFASATTAYSASVSNATTSITLTPTKSDVTASIAVNGITVASGTASGNIPLAVGANTITIVVTAQNGTSTKTYTLTLTRAQSAVNDLSNLVFSTGALTPEFDTEITSYVTGVSSSTPSLTVTPTVTDATATVKVNGTTVVSGSASTAISLASGSNVINTVVTAQNGSIKTYTVNVTKSSLSPNSNLSNLSLSSGSLSPSFAQATTDYTASVTNAATSITLIPTVADATASVKINGVSATSGTASPAINLVVGTNTINVDVTAQNGLNVTNYSVVVTRAASNNANLNNITLSAGSLIPVFASATLGYTASVGNTTTGITVTPVVADATATIKVNGTAVTSGSASGTIPLTVGSNTITTVVTAQDGTTIKTYTVAVTRAPSAIADLSGLAVSNSTLSPTFAIGTTGYTASVSNATSTVTVTPTAADATATITVNGTVVPSSTPSGAISLTVGLNTITTKVTAQDAVTSKTYTVSITKAASSNADLSAITLSTGTVSPAFTSATTTYAATVSNATTSITVTPVKVDVASTIKVNGVTIASNTASGAIPLSVGVNTITVAVTAQDGTVKTYTLTVTRALSSNADLAGITLSSGTLNPVFASATTTYSATVSNATTSVTVTPTVSDATATVTANGNAVSNATASAAIPLAIGPNTISIAVKAQDGTTLKTYTVNIIRALSSNANLAAITLSTGSLNPVFSSANTSYTASVGNTTTTITLTPTVSDATATIKVNGTTVANGTASGAITLNVGANTITTTITAQDGTTTNTYTTVVTRAPSAVADLSGLATTAGTISPVFATGTLDYTASVANNITSVTVTPTVSSSVSSIKVNGITVNSGSASGTTPVVVGNNVINIVVTAQDGVTTKNYTLTIARAASAISSLSALAISSGTLTPAFSTGTIIYTSSVANSVTSLTVTPTATDATATIKVNGTIVNSGAASAAVALNVGANTITTIVTAQNGIAMSTYTVTVTRASTPQIITFTAISSTPVGTPDFFPGATSTNSTIPITYTSSNTAVATIVAGKIHTIGVGTTNITAAQAAGTGFLAATSVVQPLVITQGTRTLTFNAITPRTFGDSDFDPGATVTSGEAITYTSSDLSVVTIVSGKIHIMGGGSATITANVPNTANYNVLTPAFQQVVINPAAQTITFNPLINIKMGSYGLVLIASASSLLPVTFSSQDNNIATINGNAVAQVSAGTVTIVATQAGNANYLPASATQLLTITPQIDLVAAVQIHEGFSPNGDGINDFLVIDGISTYPDNKLTIVTRNGAKVAQINNYDNRTNIFDGHASNGSLLQQGTYFYSLEFRVAGVANKKSGFIIIKN